MKYIILPSTILFLILGCGVMSTPNEEKDEIHVPQNITVKLPDILISDKNKSQVKEKIKAISRWYD